MFCIKNYSYTNRSHDQPLPCPLIGNFKTKISFKMLSLGLEKNSKIRFPECQQNIVQLTNEDSSATIGQIKTFKRKITLVTFSDHS